MANDVILTTEQCADKLNQAYGWQAVTRQRLHREIDSGRLVAQKVPAVGTRERALVRITWSDFVAYCQVYHPDVAVHVASQGST